MLHSYAAWCRKRAGTAQCSPALAAAGILLVLGIVIYVYRQLIITTIIDAVLAAVCVCVLVATVAVVLSTLRWYRRKAADERARMAAPVTMVPHWPAEDRVVDDDDAAAISKEAEWLASGVELAFGPDGTLKAKK
jgi:hypothetical protein